jgi:hypothetical protein
VSLSSCLRSKQADSTSYNSHSTKQRLSELDAKKLTPLIPDKESRRSVQQALKGITSGEVCSIRESQSIRR